MADPLKSYKHDKLVINGSFPTSDEIGKIVTH